MSHMFPDVPRFNFFFYTVCGDVIHCFEATGENDVCNVRVYMYGYVCTYCDGHVYFTCPCILRVRSRTFKHLIVQHKLTTLPSLAAWLPMVLTSVTPLAL